MHTADYITARREVLLFRGGDGREYLNDLHGLNIDTMHWTKLQVSGVPPEPRANHSSAVVGANLFVFGGWDGQKRLNDIHVLDTDTLIWTCPEVRGTLPHPRAGMTFTRLRHRLFLFGGSGPQAKCFNDMQVFDPDHMSWIDTAPAHSSNSGNPEDGASNKHNTYLAEGPRGGPGDGAATGGGSIGAGSGGGNGGGSSSAQPQQQLQSEGLGIRVKDSVGVEGMGMGMGGGDGDANPNDNPSGEQIVILSDWPGRRAGHTTTVANRRLLVFGGSYGSEYLNDFYILDTDPPPEARISLPSSSQVGSCAYTSMRTVLCYLAQCSSPAPLAPAILLPPSLAFASHFPIFLQVLQQSLAQFVNNDRFSDVSFIVEGKVVYGHKVILSLLSDRFRAMFSSGFRESSQKEIVIPDIRYVN
jgi:hypothetical protein